MKRLTIMAVAVISVTFALDLETVQKNSQRHRGFPLPAMEKRRIHIPSNANMFKEYNGDPSASRLSQPQQYYRRVQELLANIVSQENRADPNWLENLRQRDMNLRQMADIRPPYDQDDFPAYSQKPQEDSLRWAPPAPQIIRLPAAEKRQVAAAASYRSHKQLPFSTRVPQEEMMKKRSVDSNADHVKVGELNQDSGVLKNTRSDGSKKAFGNENKAETAEQTNSTSGNKMSPDQFQQWLTDEYYRNMAMSFATMRKKRSILEQTAEVQPTTRDDEAAFEKLRLLEDTLLQETLREMLHGTTERHGIKPNARDMQKIDVAHDIEVLKKMLQNLVVDTAKLKANDEAEIMAALKDAKKDNTVDLVTDEPTECPELQLLTSGCAALRGMFPPDPIQGQFVVSCNWHEVCYACGAQHGVSADQCDKSFLLDMKFLCRQLGSCNPSLTSLLLAPLHKKRIYFKQSVLPICERPCVVNFLART